MIPVSIVDEYIRCEDLLNARENPHGLDDITSPALKTIDRIKRDYPGIGWVSRERRSGRYNPIDIGEMIRNAKPDFRYILKRKNGNNVFEYDERFWLPGECMVVVQEFYENLLKNPDVDFVKGKGGYTNPNRHFEVHYNDGRIETIDFEIEKIEKRYF